ncbi:MAG: hypothetical protein AAF927_32040 [Bacteroidota bacterium]
MLPKRNRIHNRDFLMALFLSQIEDEKLDAASQTLTEYLALSKKNQLPVPEVLQNFSKWIERRKKSPRFALLVSVNGPNTQNTELDIDAWQKCLLDHMGYQASNITLLKGADASREQIIIAYNKLVAQSRRFPATFIYAGTGSVRSGEPTQYGLLAYDSIDAENNSCQEILLQSLADASIKAKTLSVILDIGWSLLYDRAYGVGGYFEEDTLDHIPLVGTSMMTSAFVSPENSMKQLVCLENEQGSLFSQQLIAQISKDGAGYSFRHYRDRITQSANNTDFTFTP